MVKLQTKRQNLDLPLSEATLAFVDLEMTGLDPKEDKIVEICIHLVRGEELLESFSSLIKPDSKLGGNRHIHGLGELELQSAPPFGELAAQITRYLEQGIPVFHAAKLDLSFLKNEMMRSGMEFQCEIYLDTLLLSRKAFFLPSHALPYLAVHFGLGEKVMHRAEEDVLVTRKLFALCTNVLRPHHVRDLIDIHLKESEAKESIFSRCEEAIKLGTLLRLVYRQKGHEPRLLVIKPSHVARDPFRIFGYDTYCRSRLELRVDRILSAEIDG